MHVLSKSTYIRSLQCLKSLYLYKNFYKERDPISINQQLLFDRGHKVGKLAHQLFPGGIDVSPDNHYKWSESAEKTAKLILNGQGVIYEAAFIFEGVLAAVDILKKTESGWIAFEVKSNLDIKTVHRRDAALQYYVINNSGIKLDDFALVHINREYKKKGSIDVNEYFIIKSLLSDCKKEQQTVYENIKKAKHTLTLSKTPEINIGNHCQIPYKCDFYGTCWKAISTPNVFDLEELDIEQKFDLFNKGLIYYDDIMHHLKLTKLQRTQILTTTKKNLFIDTKELSNFFSSFTYPLHFLDFRILNSSVPVFDGTVPFQMIPYAYSLYIKDIFNEKNENKFFMAENGYNPFPNLLTSILNKVHPLGDIFISNKETTLNILQHHFDPSIHSSQLFNSFIERSREFYEPFLKTYYYHPNLKSRSTVKKIFEALIGIENKELDIFSTDEQNSDAFENLEYENDIMIIAETRQNIQQYSMAQANARLLIYDSLKSLLNK